ncbi:MAG: hypothetical protein L0G99_06655 [Propionibacteriales bacterium]|nr:hypothetical protein [Propionibacteriales bacterium]
MSQPPNPQSGPDFGRRPSAGGFTPQNDYSHPDFPTGPVQQPARTMQPPAPTPPPPARRNSPALGIVALFLVAIAVVIHTPLVFQTSTTFHTIEQYSYGDPEYTQANNSIWTILALQLIPAGLGLVGLVLGIIAAASRRGTMPGVIAIILSVLAPIVLLLVFLVSIQGLLDLT